MLLLALIPFVLLSFAATELYDVSNNYLVKKAIELGASPEEICELKAAIFESDNPLSKCGCPNGFATVIGSNLTNPPYQVSCRRICSGRNQICTTTTVGANITGSVLPFCQGNEIKIKSECTFFQQLAPSICTDPVTNVTCGSLVVTPDVQFCTQLPIDGTTDLLVPYTLSGNRCPCGTGGSCLEVLDNTCAPLNSTTLSTVQAIPCNDCSVNPRCPKTDRDVDCVDKPSSCCDRPV